MITALIAGRVVTQDALGFLADLEANSVDLIVSSPPYFMGKKYDRSDKVEDFLRLHQELAPLLNRVLRSGGSLCWQVGHHVRGGVSFPLDILTYQAFCSEASLLLRNRIIWTFGHGMHAKRRFSGRYETVLWYTKGDDYYFNLDAVRVPQKYPGKKHYKGPMRGHWSGNPRGKNPSDVWEIPNVKANHVEKLDHPCQFPVALVQRLVRALCPPGGLVVDCFSGTGTTGVAALIEGRNFFGCDTDSDYVRLAEQRLRSCLDGTIRYRSVDIPLFVPQEEMAVAKRPSHFAAFEEKT
jgi:adenine-specific DNA-methyltransferase